MLGRLNRIEKKVPRLRSEFSKSVQNNNVVETTKTTLSEKCRTHNWRFGASGGVAPQKVKWEHER